MVGSYEDRIEKQERIARLRGRGAAILLTSHEALAWYLEGVRTHVSLAGPPVLAVRADASGDVLYVADSEADRLIAEELLPADAERIVRVPWWIPPTAAAAEAGPAVPEAEVAGALRAARARMLPAERARYRLVGRDTAAVLTDALDGVGPSRTERETASVVAAGLVAHGIDPLVVLVSGAERAAFRHPLPTDAVLGGRAMIVVCGRRDGLIANATRWVGESVDDGPVLAVERAFLDASEPGSRLDAAFAAGCAAYARNGFEAGEWRRHHQGGPTGYAGRDPRATSATDDLLVEDQAFAWNPTGPGVKVEDTMLRTADGWEVLTADERWPSAEFGGLLRPVTRPYGS